MALSVAEKILKDSASWEQIKRQFSNEEQKVFVKHWEEIYNQFKGDILATEQLNIIDMIKMDLLANRILESAQSCKQSIKNLEELIAVQMEKPEKQRDARTIEGAESSIIANREAVSSLDRQYLNILDKKDTYMKSIKGNREQRIKDIRDSKQNMMDWIKLMITSPEKRHAAGVAAEKMRLAFEKERTRLSELNTYADGELDRPILDSTSVQPEDSN